MKFRVSYFSHLKTHQKPRISSTFSLGHSQHVDFYTHGWLCHKIAATAPRIISSHRSRKRTVSLNISLSLFFFFFFYFWPYLQHVEVPELGSEPTPQQWPKPLQWQCWILNLLHQQRIPCLSFWFTTLSIRTSSSIHVAANGISFSSLWLSNIPLYIYVPHVLYPFFLMDI